MGIYQDICYGCAACAQICPQQAIQMQEEPDGAPYPMIDADRCISCRLCEAVCPDRRKRSRSSPKAGYAAVCTDEKLLRRAASGGVFSALAKAVLSAGGVVCGSSLIGETGIQKPRHILIEKIEELPRLQGSKYAHSSTAAIYGQVLEQLQTGRPVLFSGTPCQVDGLYGFLQGKRFANLWTVDLICHGVPAAKILENYIRCLERKRHIRVWDLRFRGKSGGWGQFAYSLRYTSRGGAMREVERPAGRSSYYWLFLQGALYRESCYACPYASLRRAADLTIGDWWGIEKEYPAYIGEGEDCFRLADGVSCLLVNTEQGMEALERFGSCLKKRPTDPAAVARGNRQLRAPQVPPPFAKQVRQIYREEGYEGLERWYGQRLGYKKWAYAVWDALTDGIKRNR